MAGKGINSQVPLIITDYVLHPILILSEPGTQTQLLQETFSNKLQNLNLLVPWNLIGKLSSVWIHITWPLILNCSKWFHVAQIWLPNKEVNAPGSEATNFMSFCISHSSWGKTCHTTNHTKFGRSCHMLRAPLWAWTCSLCSSQYDRHVANTEKTHT